jgi:hypothetical protein
MEIVDRYSATGIPRPTKDSCDKCEGMGVNPEQKATLNEEALKSPTGTLLIIGQKNTEEDDWVFVQCPYCKGTRMKGDKV